MHIIGLKFLFLNAIKILYHMWCDILFLFIFIFFCEKHIMRVDKVRLSWFILLNSYVLKKRKRKKKKVIIYIQKEQNNTEILPIWMWKRLSWFFLSNSYILKNKRKKVVIYFQKEKKRKEKNSEVNYASIMLRPTIDGW